MHQLPWGTVCDSGCHQAHETSVGVMRSWGGAPSVGIAGRVHASACVWCVCVLCVVGEKWVWAVGLHSPGNLAGWQDLAPSAAIVHCCPTLVLALHSAQSQISWGCSQWPLLELRHGAVIPW